MKTITGCEYCGKADRTLTMVNDQWVCAFCKDIITDTGIYALVNRVTQAVDTKLTNSSIVISATKGIINRIFASVLTLADITRRKVRLYVIEGEHLSLRDGEQKRLTWYTHPEEARVIGEYMGRLTGRLVYIDLELDCTSDYSHRFYKHGHEAFILQGDLIKLSKNKWKYFDEKSFVEVEA
jgi:hypothetical protein